MTIKLIKSLNGRHKKHIATAHSLGLKRIGDTTEQPDNVQTKGKVAQICYLITVTETAKPAAKPKAKAAPKAKKEEATQ